MAEAGNVILAVALGLALGGLIEFCIRRDVDLYLNIVLVGALLVITVCRAAA